MKTLKIKYFVSSIFFPFFPSDRCFFYLFCSFHLFMKITNLGTKANLGVLANLGVDGWIILGWVSRRWDVGLWTGLGWPRIETGGGRL